MSDCDSETETAQFFSVPVFLKNKDHNSTMGGLRWIFI